MQLQRSHEVGGDTGSLDLRAVTRDLRDGAAQSVLRDVHADPAPCAGAVEPGRALAAVTATQINPLRAARNLGRDCSAMAREHLSLQPRRMIFVEARDRTVQRAALIVV